MSGRVPLFATGVARSGSTLLCHLLTAHPDVLLAADPYLELFRSLRNALIRRRAGARLRDAFDPASPLQDYYLTDDRIALMDLVQSSGLDVPFDPAEWPALLEVCRARAAFECPDIVPHLDGLGGRTYKEIFDNSLAILARARGAESRRLVGFKEVWTVEFFAPLARAYPEARFLIIHRDPRAVVASMLALGETDPTQTGHVLSYARHWRKYVAFAVHYENDPLFRKRLSVVTYEHLVRAPKDAAAWLCEALEVPYDPAMLDTSRYVDHARGGVWRGNSSFRRALDGIEATGVEQWRTSLPAEVLKTIEFVCAPEMRWLGYEPVAGAAEAWGDPDVLACLIKHDGLRASWRSDLGEPQSDYGGETFRRALLRLPVSLTTQGAIRRTFLFPDVFARLRGAPDPTAGLG